MQPPTRAPAAAATQNEQNSVSDKYLDTKSTEFKNLEKKLVKNAKMNL